MTVHGAKPSTADTLNIAGKRIGPPEIEGAITATGKVIDAAAIAPIAALQKDAP